MPNHTHTPGAHCAECGATGELFIHSRCHPESPTWAVLKGDRLTIQCAECDKPIATFPVGPAEKQPDAKTIN